jgi:hypothetical protein
VSTTGRAPTTTCVVSSADDDGLGDDGLDALEVLVELLQAAARTATARLAAAAADARLTCIYLMTLLTIT